MSGRTDSNKAMAAYTLGIRKRIGIADKFSRGRVLLGAPQYCQSRPMASKTHSEISAKSLSVKGLTDFLYVLIKCREMCAIR